MALLDLEGVDLDVQAGPEHEANSSWNLDGSITLEMRFPAEWPKARVYDEVYAMALHELTHVRQFNRGEFSQRWPESPLEYVLGRGEVEAHLKQFRELLRRGRYPDLPTLMRSYWKDLLSTRELEEVIPKYEEAFVRMYGRPWRAKMACRVAKLHLERARL